MRFLSYFWDVLKDSFGSSRQSAPLIASGFNLHDLSVGDSIVLGSVAQADLSGKTLNVIGVRHCVCGHEEFVSFELSCSDGCIFYMDILSGSVWSRNFYVSLSKVLKPSEFLGLFDQDLVRTHIERGAGEDLSSLVAPPLSQGWIGECYYTEHKKRLMEIDCGGQISAYQEHLFVDDQDLLGVEVLERNDGVMSYFLHAYHELSAIDKVILDKN